MTKSRFFGILDIRKKFIVWLLTAKEADRMKKRLLAALFAAMAMLAGCAGETAPPEPEPPCVNDT